MPDHTLPDQNLGLGRLFKTLAIVGVLYYVLFAGLGLETDGELSRITDNQPQRPTTESASN